MFFPVTHLAEVRYDAAKHDRSFTSTNRPLDKQNPSEPLQTILLERKND